MLIYNLVFNLYDTDGFDDRLYGEISKKFSDAGFPFWMRGVTPEMLRGEESPLTIGEIDDFRGNAIGFLIALLKSNNKNFDWTVLTSGRVSSGAFEKSIAYLVKRKSELIRRSIK